MRCVTRILVQGHLPAAIEFLDHACLALVGELLPFPLPPGAGALLLLEADGPEAQARADIQAMGAICTELGALALLSATNDTQRDELWHMRRQVSVRIHEQAAIYVPEDVVVPIGRIAALVEALPRIERTHALRVYAFGHAGDGNIHLNFTAQDAAAAPNVERAVREALSLVLDLGGTISGEHGIGLAKKRFLPLELSPRSIRLQRDIKELFDPGMILNPGKMF
jgi:glycolate oxidase